MQNLELVFQSRILFFPRVCIWHGFFSTKIPKKGRDKKRQKDEKIWTRLKIRMGLVRRVSCAIAYERSFVW